jgi:hypothetical protein
VLFGLVYYATSSGREHRLRLKCDGTRTETRFRLSAKRTSPFKSVGASVQSTAGSRGVRISGSNAGYTMFRDSVKSTGYPLHSPVSPLLPLPALLCAITFQLDSTHQQSYVKSNPIHSLTKTRQSLCGLQWPPRQCVHTSRAQVKSSPVPRVLTS